MGAIRTTLALAIVAFCGNALGDSYHIDLNEMPNQADVVALVEIVAGETVTGTNGVFCGAMYQARVQRAVKGVTDGTLIKFGRFIGRRIGMQYFVFLAHKGSRYAAGYDNISTRSRPGLIKELKENCEPAYPALVEMYQGMGSIPVGPGQLAGYRASVRLSNPPYLLPADLKAVREPGGFVADGLYFGTVEIEVEDFYQFIRNAVSLGNDG